jgi:hypothetical protein
MTTETPKTVYHLILQDAGRDLARIADIVSLTPFPRFESGDTLNVLETQPQCWDVSVSMTTVNYSPDRKELHLSTCLVVDSPCERETLSN